MLLPYWINPNCGLLFGLGSTICWAWTPCWTTGINPLMFWMLVMFRYSSLLLFIAICWGGGILLLMVELDDWLFITFDFVEIILCFELLYLLIWFNGLIKWLYFIFNSSMCPGDIFFGCYFITIYNLLMFIMLSSGNPYKCRFSS